MKNTKTIKTILFTAIFSAMIIPVSIIQISAISDQGNNTAVAEIEEIRKVVEPYLKAKSDLSNTQNELEVLLVNGTSQQIAEKELRIQQLKMDIATYESTLSDMERQSIERHKIEPELEQRLRIAQQSVNDSELPVTGTSVSGIHKALVIYIDSTQLTADKNRTYYTELIQNRYSDIPVIVRFGESKLESCTVPTSNCDPLIGGIQMEAKNHSYCTIGLAIPRGGIDGFITAGHCVDDTSGSGDDVYQPTEDLFGSNKVGDVSVDLYQAQCDCAWIDQSSADGNQKSVWSNTNTWTAITSFTNRPSSGTNVMLHGATSTLAYAVVDDPYATATIDGITFDVVDTTTDVSSGGDSGGAWTNYSSNNFMGTHQGAVDGSRSFFIPWENVKSSTNGLGL